MVELINKNRLKRILEKNFGHTGGASVLMQLIDAQPVVSDRDRWKARLRETIEDFERDCNPENDAIFDALVELHAYRAAVPLEKVQELAKAEREGRLVVLPCKIGDTVYIILDSLCSHLNSHHTRYCTECNGNEIERNHYDGGSAKEICTVKFAYRLMRSIGKTVFLTREEAQAALEGREGQG